MLRIAAILTGTNNGKYQFLITDECPDFPDLLRIADAQDSKSSPMYSTVIRDRQFVLFEVDEAEELKEINAGNMYSANLEFKTTITNGIRNLNLTVTDISLLKTRDAFEKQASGRFN